MVRIGFIRKNGPFGMANYTPYSMNDRALLSFSVVCLDGIVYAINHSLL